MTCTLLFVGMVYQPANATVSHSSLLFKFNLKQMGCGLERKVEKAEPPGGKPPTDSSAVAAFGLCYR